MSGQRPYEKPHGLTFRSFAVHSQGERMGGKTLSEKRLLQKASSAGLMGHAGREGGGVREGACFRGKDRENNAKRPSRNRRKTCDFSNS